MGIKDDIKNYQAAEGRRFYTIQDIENMIHPKRKIVSAEQQGKWICLTLDTGMVIKIRNF